MRKVYICTTQCISVREFDSSYNDGICMIVDEFFHKCTRLSSNTSCLGKRIIFIGVKNLLLLFFHLFSNLTIGLICKIEQTKRKFN